MSHSEASTSKATEKKSQMNDEKRAEEALKKSEDRLQTIASRVPGIIFEYRLRPDGTSHIPYISEGMRKFSQYGPEDVYLDIKKTFETVHPDDVEAYNESIRKSATDLTPWQHEYRVIYNNKVYTLYGNSVPKREDDGSIVWHGHISDITNRKQAEKALRESEEKHRLLVQNLQAGVVVHAQDTRIILANEQASILLGVSVEEMVGKKVGDPAWQCVLEDGTPMPFEEHPVNQVLSKRQSVRGLTAGIVRPGCNETTWVHVNAFAEKEPDGTLRQIVMTFVDISDRKRAEEEKQKRENLQKQLLQAQKMESVGRLAGGVAHDFNNMLGIILGNAELALEDLPKDSPVRARLKQIKKTAQRSENLTRQLLAFARRQPIDPKLLDINEAVFCTLNMLKRLIGENIDLIWTPKQELGLVRMDPGQVDQLLANLVVNARDAIGHTAGKITIETGNTFFDDAYCSNHQGFTAGDYVMLAVSDNGCGMDEQTLANIFEPFFSTKDVGKGTGLGLATVYGAVKQNNGHVAVESKQGQGTAVRIYLPTQTGKPERFERKTDSADSLVKGTETILLVEDEPTILNMTTEILKKVGYNVLATASPTEAILLAKANSDAIDMLFSDVVMPEINGKELLQILLPLHPKLKHLFTSGYTADIIAHHGVLDHGVCFIPKPFSIRDLATKVRQVLDGE